MSETYEKEVVQEILAGPKPVTCEISTEDIQALFVTTQVGPGQFNPYVYSQLILAKLKDAGAPVEGVLHLRLAHGKVFKQKTSDLVEQQSFTYIWLPEAYVDGIKGMMKEAGQC
jgi:hypothetical protein